MLNQSYFALEDDYDLYYRGWALEVGKTYIAHVYSKKRVIFTCCWFILIFPFQKYFYYDQKAIAFL